VTPGEGTLPIVFGKVNAVAVTAWVLLGERLRLTGLGTEWTGWRLNLYTPHPVGFLYKRTPWN